MRIEHHPKLNVWVREDGCVYLPQSGKHPAHWTFGCKDDRGYLKVKTNKKLYYVHRLVAETFLPNPENLPEVDHINRNKEDNRAFENLRWVSSSQNNRNTNANDRVEIRGGTHAYEDEKQYYKEKSERRCKTHKNILFSDGKQRWVPNEQATELLKLPVKERVWKDQ